MIGKLYSSSQNACMIRFVGGPYDGREGLYDHDRFDSIGFCHEYERTTYEYRPDGPRRFRFSHTYHWEHE